MIGIKGIKMPKNCIECDHLDLREALGCQLIYSGCANCGRHPDCPLVEIITCKNCKYRDPEDKFCDCGHTIKWSSPRDDNFYCEDAVSRQAVLDLMRSLTRWCVRSEDGKFNNVGLLYDDVMFGIEQLSPVTPQQKISVDVLDKIRAEIEAIIGEKGMDDYDFCSGLICARNIIDKYKESEDK